MKILQITASDNSIGGASRIACDLHQDLPKLKIESEMFSGHKSSEESEIHKIPKSLTQKILSRIFASDIDFFDTDFIIDSEPFKTADLIQCHNLHGWYFNLNTFSKMCSKKPVVWTLHDMWALTSHCAHTSLTKKKNELYVCPPNSPYPHLLWDNSSYLSNKKKNIYENSNFYITTPSQWLANKVKDTCLGIKKIKVIPNGVDLTIFKPLNKTETKKDLKLPTDKKIILFVSSGGINNPFKGGNFFIDIAKKYENEEEIRFVCLGGDKNYECKNIIYRKKIFKKEMMAKYLSASDVLLFPSTAENLPINLLEAGACGLPTVCFNVGGIPEIIKHKENGYLAKEISQENLKEGLDWLINLTEKETTDIKDNAINNIRLNFSLEKMILSYVEYYNEILKEYKQ